MAVGKHRRGLTRLERGGAPRANAGVQSDKELGLRRRGGFAPELVAWTICQGGGFFFFLFFFALILK